MPRRPVIDIPLESLSRRIAVLRDIVKSSADHPGNMIFFVMYDIENGKVRRYIAKYLLRSGCHRVQKSIFLADLPIEKYNEIKSDLAAVQSVYDNDDSVLVTPVPADYIKSMSVIGHNLNIDLILRTRNTLFF